MKEKLEIWQNKMNERDINAIKEEVDNYVQTVHAILCFNQIIAREINQNSENSSGEPLFFYMGRKMRTSSNNRISPNNDITPDIIIQINENYGIVGEVKKSLPRDTSFWSKYRDQIIKYDDDLVGWISQNYQINSHDIVLLTHMELKNTVIQYIEKVKTEENIHLDKKFAYIGFFKSSGRINKVFFEIVNGNLSNDYLNSYFHQMCSISLESVIFSSNIKDVKLYDAKPPEVYLMEILWTNIFTQYITEEQFRSMKGKKIIPFFVHVDDLKEKVRSQYTYSISHDDRQPEIPRRKWIVSAMDKFVDLKHAEKNSDGQYKVKYKKIDFALETFCQEIINGRSEEDTKQSRQITLIGI